MSELVWVCDEETVDGALGLNLVMVLVYKLEFSLLSIHSIVGVSYYPLSFTVVFLHIVVSFLFVSINNAMKLQLLLVPFLLLLNYSFC